MRRTVLCSIGLLGGICLVETPAQALAQGPCVDDTLISRPRDCDGNTEDRHFIGRFGPLAPGWNSETDSGIEPIRVPRVQLAPGEELLSVELSGRLVLTGSWSAENLGTSPCNLEVVYEPSGHTWIGAGGLYPLHYLGPEFRENFELDTFDGTVDYAGPSGHVFETPPGGLDDEDETGFTPGPIYDYLIGTHPGHEVEIQHSVEADFYDTGCFETAALLDFQVELVIEVHYIVCLSTCNADPPLYVSAEVPFSFLDGSAADQDGVSDGVLTIPGLVIGAWGKIVVDVPVATFLVSGDVLLAGEGKIDNYSWPLPEEGPEILLITCGTIRLQDRSRIRSHGDRAGGGIFLCAGGDIVMEGIAGIECNAFDLQEGAAGGSIYLSAGNRFEMNGYLTYITAEGVEAGIVEIVACGTDSDAIRIQGRVLADGTGRQGVGGQIFLDARWGGIWLPGVNKCLATGYLCDGMIILAFRTVLGPNVYPIVKPAPVLIPDGPDHGLCSCLVASGG